MGLRRGLFGATLALFWALSVHSFAKDSVQIILEKKLFQAVATGNMAKVKQLFVYADQPNILDENGRTLLFFAPNKGVAAFLLSKGVQPGRRDTQGATAAEFLAQKEKFDVAYFLKKLGKPAGPPPLPTPKPAPGKPPIPTPPPVPAIPSLPQPDREDVFLYINDGKPMDMNAGNKILRLRALARIGKNDAMKLGFVPSEGDEPKTSIERAFGKAQPAFQPHAFAIMDGLSSFFSDLEFKDGQFFHPEYTAAGKALPLTREQIRILATVHLRHGLGYGWLKALVFPNFIINN